MRRIGRNKKGLFRVVVIVNVMGDRTVVEGCISGISFFRGVSGNRYGILG